jgi:uridine kinase
MWKTYFCCIRQYTPLVSLKMEQEIKVTNKNAPLITVSRKAKQKASQLQHNTPAHRPRNHTLYDVSPIRFVFQVTQKDLRSSLMMADYCRNM